MNIRRASVRRQLGARYEAGEAARIQTTNGAADLSYGKWIEEGDWAIIDPAGVPLAEGADGFVGFSSEIAGTVLRTVSLGNLVLIYG